MGKIRMEPWNYHSPTIFEPLLYLLASAKLLREPQQPDIGVHCTTTQ